MHSPRPYNESQYDSREYSQPSSLTSSPITSPRHSNQLAHPQRMAFNNAPILHNEASSNHFQHNQPFLAAQYTSDNVNTGLEYNPHNGSENNVEHEDIDISDLDEVDEAQMKAIRTWTLLVKICFGLHMITALALLKSYYWLSTVVGLGMLVLFYIYAHCAHIQRKHFVFLYLLVVALNFARDLIILIFWIKDLEDDVWDYTLLVLIFVDACAITPASLYSCFYLYRSTSIVQLTM